MDNTQALINQIIENEIYVNASTMVTDLINEGSHWTDHLLPACTGLDYSEAPDGYNIEETIDGDFMVLCNGIQTGDNVNEAGAGDDTYETEHDAVVAAWEHSGEEPPEIEALQHWIVSDRLADDLEQVGALVARDVLGFEIWGRTECGQSLTMDSDLRKVAELIETRLQDMKTGRE